MKLYSSRFDPKKLRYILHCLAIRNPTETLALALSQHAFLLPDRNRAPDSSGAHVCMEGVPHHFQYVLRGLDETIEPKTAIVHRKRERRVLVLAGGNTNGEAGSDFEAERIVEQTAFFRRLCASRLTSIPQQHPICAARLLKNRIDVVVSFSKIVAGPTLRIGRDQIGAIRALAKIGEPTESQSMRCSFRDTPKIIFCMSRVKTIDKLIACSFNIFHCATSVTYVIPKTRESIVDSRFTCMASIDTLRQLCGKNNSKPAS